MSIVLWSTGSVVLTKEYLTLMYVDNGLSTRQIAAEAQVSAGQVRWWLKKHGIPARSKSEALSGDRNPMFGKAKPEDVRKRTSATLRETNQLPEVKARRRAAVAGGLNPMFGRTHAKSSLLAMSAAQTARCALPEVREAYSERMKAAWATPEVREAWTEAARQRLGPLNPFHGRTHSTETREAISRANRGRFQGEKGSNWKGGRTKLVQLVRNSEPAIRWRQAVYERDAFTCRFCGRVGGALHADHIEPLALLMKKHRIQTLDEALACEALWDLNNGRTLCVPCHKTTPSFAGNFQKNYGG